MSSSDDSCPPPIPNSYWVEPGRLLAGEYPGAMSRADAIERLQRLLQAGIDSFLDLTEEGELPDYDHILPGLTERQLRYCRLSILDHGLPDSAAHMTRILDRIESELAAGRCVYVHCHAGIGRTGMAIGCHLIRGGLTNDAALARLQVLWQQCARARRWPSVPETAEQVEYVRQWRESARPDDEPGLGRSRREGALVGLALADALGTLLATSNFDAATLVAGLRESGGLATGVHTAMTRAVAESLLVAGGHDPEDQMQRYLQWMRAAEDLPVPTELKRALGAWQWSKKPHAGSHDPRNLDPHSLPRTLAAALFMRPDAAAAIELAAEISRTTQQAPLVLDLCRFWAALFVDALEGLDKETLLAFRGPGMQLLRRRQLKKPLKRFLEERSAGEGELANAREQAGLDAMSATQVALDAFAHTDSLRDGLIQVTAVRRASPAAAALCGALSGAHYGVEAVPMEWRRQLPEDPALRSLLRHLPD